MAFNRALLEHKILRHMETENGDFVSADDFLEFALTIECGLESLLISPMDLFETRAAILRLGYEKVEDGYRLPKKRTPLEMRVLSYIHFTGGACDFQIDFVKQKDLPNRLSQLGSQKQKLEDLRVIDMHQILGGEYQQGRTYVILYKNFQTSE